MVSAYVLINCDIGSVEDVISHLKTIDGLGLVVMIRSQPTLDQVLPSKLELN